MAEIAVESGHYYDREGNPRYTIIGKNGKERATTVRDARKELYVPSVSGIVNIPRKPGLELYKVKQAIYSSLTLARLPEESDDDYVNRLILDSKEHANQAAEKGSAGHGSLELAYQRKPYPEEHEPYVSATIKAVKELTGLELEDFDPERSFASPLGYGGKVDLPSIKGGWVLDFKFKEFGEDKKAKDLAWPEHAMQLSAYGHGLGLPHFRAANVFISTNTPGLVLIHEWTHEELGRGFSKFMKLLDYWKLDNNYESGW